jgi:hypothetical protein
MHPTVAASLLALAGVGFGLWQNRLAIRRQHLLVTRREVYLESCDITAESMAYLLTMAQSTLTEGLKIMQKLGGMNGKLHLIATRKTLTLADKYLGAFLDEYINAAAPKTKLEMNRIEVELANAQIKTLQNAAPPTSRVSEFVGAIVSWNNRIVELSEESQTLTAQTIAATTRSVERLDPLATEVTLSMREEIELRIDSEKWFRDLRRDAIAKNASRSEPFQKSVKGYLAMLHSKRPDMPQL